MVSRKVLSTIRADMESAPTVIKILHTQSFSLRQFFFLIHFHHLYHYITKSAERKVFPPKFANIHMRTGLSVRFFQNKKAVLHGNAAPAFVRRLFVFENCAAFDLFDDVDNLRCLIESNGERLACADGVVEVFPNAVCADSGEWNIFFNPYEGLAVSE